MHCFALGVQISFVMVHIIGKYDKIGKGPFRSISKISMRKFIKIEISSISRINKYESFKGMFQASYRRRVLVFTLGSRGVSRFSTYLPINMS
jgi:hypothetical protein